MTFLPDVPVLDGTLVRLAPLSMRHAPDLMIAAEEDRGAYRFTRVPRAQEVEEYLARHFELAGSGRLDLAGRLGPAHRYQHRGEAAALRARVRERECGPGRPEDRRSQRAIRNGRAARPGGAKEYGGARERIMTGQDEYGPPPGTLAVRQRMWRRHRHDVTTWAGMLRASGRNT